MLLPPPSPPEADAELTLPLPALRGRRNVTPPLSASIPKFMMPLLPLPLPLSELQSPLPPSPARRLDTFEEHADEKEEAMVAAPPKFSFAKPREFP